MAAPTKRCTFDNVTEGATLSAANTASSGDAIVTPNVTATGDAKAKASALIRGAKGVELTGVSGDAFGVRLSITASSSASTQLYFTTSAANRPSSGVWCIVRLRNTSTNVCKLIMSSSGVVSIQNSAGSGLKNFNSNTPLADGAYVVNMRAAKGTGTGDGTINCDIYNAATNTLVSDGSYSSTAVNAGTADITETQAGIPEALTGNLTAIIDELAILAGSTAEIDFVAAALDDQTATVTAGRAIIEATNGTAPFTITQTAGTTTTPTVLATGVWSVAQHAADTLTYEVESSTTNAVEVVVDPLPSGVAVEWPKRPGAAPPTTVWV